jgi:hypothetical protein
MENAEFFKSNLMLCAATQAESDVVLEADTRTTTSITSVIHKVYVYFLLLRKRKGKGKGKAVPLYAEVALGVRGGTARTLS